MLRFHDKPHPLLKYLREHSASKWGLDILHVLDYNGVTGHAIANLLADVIRDSEIPGCRTYSDTIEFLNKSLASYYKRVDEKDRTQCTRCPNLMCQTDRHARPRLPRSLRPSRPPPPGQTSPGTCPVWSALNS